MTPVQIRFIQASKKREARKSNEDARDSLWLRKMNVDVA